MGICVCGGSLLQCAFGAAPASLTVLPISKVLSSTPVATIMDNKPMVNVLPFGMCSSPSNPQVAAATAAALGVLTPMPCLPVISAPWAPGSPAVLVGGYPVLNNASKLICSWGGVIQIVNPVTMNIMVP
ncbi:MAG: DUF4280 domain-containing protein [Lacrimispora sp.]|uniref:DUF4280 domain-containing protein n=1 Tax=Lacrimispora sp. TaxID=2719234 RepID=UPI0039E3B649